MLGVIAGTPRCCQEIAVARLLLKILHPPRSPQRFYLRLWKFIVGHAYRPLRLKSRAAKSSRHFVCCAIPAEVANGWHSSWTLVACVIALCIRLTKLDRTCTAMHGARIDYLIDHPEYIPQLAQWLFEEWGSILGEKTPAARIK